jgi:septal ring factor EnvC (AmiA/AmiB activator)
MKVDQLTRQISGSGRGGMFPGGGRRGAQGDQPGAAQEGEMTAMEKASQALRTSLRNESTSPDEIKKQLAALRTAREAAKKDLAVAQQELRKSVNIRQEAQLVLMGLLD